MVEKSKCQSASVTATTAYSDHQRTHVRWVILTLVTGLVPGTTLVSTTLILTTLVVLRFLVGVVQAPLFPVTL